MRGQPLLLGIVLVTLAFAGCVEDMAGSGKSAKNAKGLGGGKVADLAGKLVPVAEGLWYDPETTPHPAYNYPTLSHPPAEINNPWLKPIPMGAMPAKIVGLQQAAQVKDAPSGAGMSLIGSIAILPANPTRFIDISDPLKPVKVGESKERSRGSDTIVYPDGRIVAVLATGTARIGLVDITNPAAPSEFTGITSTGTHKVDVVPGTPIIYNSARGDIWDATDPSAPVKGPNAMPATCHRTYFYIEPKEDYYRAICAGFQYTHLWDIKDPLAPKLVVSIPMWHAQKDVPPSSVTPVTFSHFAILNRNHKTLIVGDEMGGGAAMACGAHVGSPAPRDASTPLGALWFYDITNEKAPVLKSWLSPSAPATNMPSSCTAHHGRLVPDPEGKRDLLAMGYYGAGVILVDFTDAGSPRILDQFNQGTSVWEAWYYNGYVFTGDGRRGLDTIKFR
ncbi:MAG TPA: hypothetical protein VI818_03175 [Candidatus Thermoplasmatota archaeon]|nr:hypothetical protein [Candidatus Thermoplasmatota archaeon]